MMGALLLAATVAMSDSTTTYSLRLGPAVVGVYEPPYGGADPYGAGGRVELGVQRGAGRFRFHALLSGTWSPFVKDDFGDTLPVSGELVVFAGAGFREDTAPDAPSALLVEFDFSLGFSRLWEAYNKPDNTTGFFPYATIYPFAPRAAIGARLATVWEVLVFQELGFGGIWEENKIFATALRGSAGLVFGRSF
jgi:hypothetical protein